MPVGSIMFQVTARESPREKTIMVKFLVVDRPSAYNVMLRRTVLSELRAITSTTHLYEVPNRRRSRSGKRRPKDG